MLGMDFGRDDQVRDRSIQIFIQRAGVLLLKLLGAADELFAALIGIRLSIASAAHDTELENKQAD